MPPSALLRVRWFAATLAACVVAVAMADEEDPQTAAAMARDCFANAEGVLCNFSGACESTGNNTFRCICDILYYEADGYHGRGKHWADKLPRCYATLWDLERPLTIGIIIPQLIGLVVVCVAACMHLHRVRSAGKLRLNINSVATGLVIAYCVVSFISWTFGVLGLNLLPALHDQDLSPRIAFLRFFTQFLTNLFLIAAYMLLYL